MHAGAWPLNWDFVLVPILSGGYLVGTRNHRPTGQRVAAFIVSQLLLLAVLVTPVETVAVHYLLAVHLLQNVVLAEWAPALLVLALPATLARRLERPRPVRAATHPLVALPVWLATYFLWHVPRIYDAALDHQHSLLHLEHATYFAAGCLVWWPVVHGRWSDGVKAVYLFAAFVLASPLGLLLALLPHPVYRFYEHAPRLWGIGRLTDQQLAGLTMAAEQAVVFFGVFTVFLMRFLRSEAIAGVYTAGEGHR